MESHDDCGIMMALTQFLQGIATADNIDTLKSEKVLGIIVYCLTQSQTIHVANLVQRAYDEFGFITNEDVLDMRRHVRLRVVQQLQVCRPLYRPMLTTLCRTQSAAVPCGVLLKIRC